MTKVLSILKEYALPIALVTGVLAYRYLLVFSVLIPYLIFAMLFFTYTKLAPRELRLDRLQALLLALQIGLGLGSYFLIRGLDTIVAEGLLICFLCPAATAAAVIVGMLGGRISFTATYVLITHLCAALFLPILFSAIGAQEQAFWQATGDILVEVLPLLVLPLASAWCIRICLPRVQKRLLAVPSVAFYLWVFTLCIIMARTTDYVLTHAEGQVNLLIYLALGGLVSCLLQFGLGKWIGRRSMGESITVGQSLGQKNTTLAIWLSQTYLHPVSSVAPASYVIWQNSINALQLWLHRRKAKKKNL